MTATLFLACNNNGKVDNEVEEGLVEAGNAIEDAADAAGEELEEAGDEIAAAWDDMEAEFGAEMRETEAEVDAEINEMKEEDYVPTPERKYRNANREQVNFTKEELGMKMSMAKRGTADFMAAEKVVEDYFEALAEGDTQKAFDMWYGTKTPDNYKMFTEGMTTYSDVKVKLGNATAQGNVGNNRYVNVPMNVTLIKPDGTMRFIKKSMLLRKDGNGDYMIYGSDM